MSLMAVENLRGFSWSPESILLSDGRAILGTDQSLDSWKSDLGSAPGGKAAEYVFRGLQEDFNATGFRKLIWLSLVNSKVIHLHNLKKGFSVDQKRSLILATLPRGVF